MLEVGKYGKPKVHIFSKKVLENDGRLSSKTERSNQIAIDRRIIFQNPEGLSSFLMVNVFLNIDDLIEPRKPAIKLSYVKCLNDNGFPGVRVL